MTCCACGRSFGGLTGFDAHQQWTWNATTDGTLSLTCLDPATMTRRDGSHMFKQAESGKWVLIVNRKHPHA